MMKKINDKIIYYSILFFPLIDLLTSIMTDRGINVSIGLIIKSLYLMYIGILYIYYNRRNVINLTILGICVIIIGLNIINNFNLIYPAFNFSYISILVKYVYFVVMALFFLYYIKEKDMKLSHLKFPIKIVLLSLVIASITNTAMLSYSSSGGLGTSGWYFSANELGSLLTLLYPVSIYLFFHHEDGKKYEFIYVVLNALYLVLLGTKVGLIGFLLVTGCYVIYRLLFIKKYSYKNGLIITLLMLIVTGCFWNEIPCIKNIQNKYDYIQLPPEMKEDEPDLIVEEEDVADEMIYSGRNRYQEKMNLLKNEEKQMNTTSKYLYNKFVGKIYLQNNNVFIIERDFHDVYYIFGILGLILVIYIILMIFIRNILKCIFKINNIKFMLLAMSTTLVIAIAFISGHTIMSPMVSFYLAVVLGFTNRELRSEKQKTKDTILINTVHMKIGGIEKTLLNLFNNINYDKYDVDLFLLLNDGEFLKLLPNEVKVHTPYGKNKLLTKIICGNNIVSKLIKHILFNKYTAFLYTTNKQYDCVIDYAGYYNFVTYYAKNIKAKKHLIWMHNSPNFILDKKKYKKFKWFDNIVLVSNDVKKELKELLPEYKDKMVVMWNLLEKPNSNSQKIAWPKCKNKIIAVGRLCNQKRYDRMIETAKILKENKYSFCIKILGSGNLEAELKEKVKDYKLEKNIIFEGSKTNIADYMNSASFLLLTSDHEGLPTVLLEALSCKLPYIATNVCGVSEVSKKIAPKNSYLLTKMEPKDIADDVMKNKLNKKFEFDIDKYNKNNIKTFEKIIK